MQEYFNIDLENDFTLGEPRTVHHKRGDAGLLECYFQSSEPNPITIMTPPLKCSRVQVSQAKRTDSDQNKDRGEFSKCIIECEVTSNEWRFSQFLDELKDTCQKIIIKNGKKWFGPVFSPSIVTESYRSLFIENSKYNNDIDRIRIDLSKELLKNLTRHDVKEFKNKYLVFQLVFRGNLVEKGIFTEMWHVNQILNAKPVTDEDSEESEDEIVCDIDNILEKEIKLSNPQGKKSKTKEHTKGDKKRKSVKSDEQHDEQHDEQNDEQNDDVNDNPENNVKENINDPEKDNIKEIKDNVNEDVREVREVREDIKKDPVQENNNEVEENIKNILPNEDSHDREKNKNKNGGKEKSRGKKSESKKKKIILSNNRKRKW